MRLAPEDIRFLVIHCTRTTPDPTAGYTLVDRLSRLRGCLECGYHFIIRTDGEVETGRPVTQPGNHCFGVNRISLGIILVGGLGPDGQPADTRTDEQREALRALLADLRQRFPKARAVTHEELRRKDGRGCPGFAMEEL